MIWLNHDNLEVQDQTKNSLWDDPCKGFPTTKGQSLVFGLPGNTISNQNFHEINRWLPYSNQLLRGEVIGRHYNAPK